MIGKLIGAAIGNRIAKGAGGGGPVGALVGAAAVTAARRLSPLTMIALAAGGYALKSYANKHKGNTVTRGGTRSYQGEGGTSS